LLPYRPGELHALRQLHLLSLDDVECAVVELVRCLGRECGDAERAGEPRARCSSLVGNHLRLHSRIAFTSHTWRCETTVHRPFISVIWHETSIIASYHPALRWQW